MVGTKAEIKFSITQSPSTTTKSVGLNSISKVKVGGATNGLMNCVSLKIYIMAQGGLSVADGCRCLTKELDMIAC